ncbi:MAG: hypothetical protein IT374_09310 [Polyangiaceae bacterium]|nr:hypothetical protein [Polyangiaceae bacterium]
MLATLRHADEVLRLAVRRDLCVARWTDTPTPRHFDEIVRAIEEAARAGDRALLLNVVDAPGKLPRFTDELRRAGGAMGARMGPLTAATAHVVLLEGFVGTSVRMFLSTLTLLSRSGGSVSTSATVEDGARWLADQRGRGRGWTPEAILEAYRATR